MDAANLPRRATSIAAFASIIVMLSYATLLWSDGIVATYAACAAIAFFGLPHGSFDLRLLRSEHRSATIGPLLLLYLGCAAAMALLWWVEPVAALVGFVAISIAHFAEDWAECRSRFLAAGIAAALITAPAVLHLVSLQAIFVALTGHAAAASLGDALLLVAPVAFMVAAAGITALVVHGHSDTALGAACSIAVMTVLPPAVGFALFFCLFHSPRHFRAALRDLRWTRAAQWLPVVAPLTLAAIGIGVALYLFGAQIETSMRTVAATFMALSILTVPHLAVPLILAMIEQRSRSSFGKVPG